MKKLILAAALTLAIGAGAALAQAGPNGGMIAGTGDHQVELVIAPAQISIYLLDDGKPTSVRGATVRAVVQEGGRTTNVALEPNGPNRLSGSLAAPLPKGARVVVSGRDSHGHAVSARFVVP